MTDLDVNLVIDKLREQLGRQAVDLAVLGAHVDTLTLELQQAREAAADTVAP